MSNAMSRNKSRWKSAALAGAAMAVLSPLMAKAQVPTMQVSLSTSSASPTTPQDYEYIAPDATVPIYVWATVTESAPVSSSNIAGLQFAYFNVNAQVSAGSPLGIITSANPTSLFGGGARNLSGGVEGAQSGFVSTTAYTGTSSIAVGDATNLTNMAKPRSVNPIWSTNPVSNGSNAVVVNGNSVSFLIETLTYTPSFNTSSGNAVNGIAGDITSFSISTPNVGVYAGANYFANAVAGNTSGGSVGASNTFTAYNASTASIYLVDAQAGDVNLDGNINGSDFGIINHNYGAGNGSTDFGWTNGDLNGDGTVNGSDFALVNHNYGVGYGPADGYGPSAIGGGVIGAPTAQIGGAAAVPETIFVGAAVAWRDSNAPSS